MFQKDFPAENNTTNGILNFIKIINTYSISFLAYKILLGISIRVASGEISCSKLKFLKSYLLWTMSQKRLNAFALISIGNEFFDNVDYENVIDELFSKSVRMWKFRKSTLTSYLLFFIKAIYNGYNILLMSEK